MAWSHWCDGTECEDKIRQDLGVTIRLKPFNREDMDQVNVLSAVSLAGVELSLLRVIKV